eukprot:5597978-Pleurochrysis_carterae.AAC.2
MAINDFPVFELALQVGGNEVPPTHRQASLRSQCRQRAKRGSSHGCAKRLLEVNSRYLRASLYTEPRFKRAATLALVHPYESYERAPRRHRRAVDDLPTTVARVVQDLRALCCGPTVAVVAEPEPWQLSMDGIE